VRGELPGLYNHNVYSTLHNINYIMWSILYFIHHITYITHRNILLYMM